jgi:hypothetical protein
MKKMLAVAMLVVVAVFAVQTVAFAASPWMDEPTYTAKAGAKLGFGLKNALLGWTELLTRPVDYHAEGKNLLDGIGSGITYAVAYTAGGAIHTGTFFIPVDLPLPNDGVQFKS